MIKISAIICTFKRPDYLRHALESLFHQTLRRDEYEIIVVDNAVQHEVEQIVRGFQDDTINLKYLTESAVGLSRARNKGLGEARGRYVAYLDDDARADEHWLESLVQGFEQNRLRPAAIGGRVWLDWQGDKPAWVPDEQLSVYTYVDHGDEAHVLHGEEYIVGANIAFDRETLTNIGGFDAKLGRQGTVLLSGEEAQVLQALRDKGLRILYEPAALVWHSVHPARRKPSWLLRRMFWDGASQPLLDREASECTRRLMLRGICADLRQCAGWFMRIIYAWSRGRRSTAWQAMLGLSQRAGRVRTRMRILTVGTAAQQ